MTRPEPDKDRCCKTVPGFGWGHVQCSRKAAVEENGKRYCRQHAPSAYAARRKASERRYDAARDEERARRRRAAIEDIVYMLNEAGRSDLADAVYAALEEGAR